MQAQPAANNRSALAAIGLVFDDKQISIPSTALPIQRAIGIARHIHIAGRIAGDGVGKVFSCGAQLAGPLLGAAAVVLGHKQVSTPRTGLPIQRALCIARHIHIAGRIAGDGGGKVPRCGAQLAGPLLGAAAVVLGDKQVSTPRTGLPIQRAS